MNDATYTRKLPCGGTLRVWANRWDIYYYFPGPDRRYKGTIVSIPGSRIDEYIAAYQTCWNDFEQMKANIPAAGELRKTANLGMSIGVGGYYEGVCIDSFHMPISEKSQLDRLLLSFEEAKGLASDAQKALFPAPLTTNTFVAEKSPLSQSQNSVAKENDTEKQLKAAPPFDPYESQRHMRGRKSHLAAAINQNIHDHPVMRIVWFVVFVTLIVGSFILSVFR